MKKYAKRGDYCVINLQCRRSFLLIVRMVRLEDEKHALKLLLAGVEGKRDRE